MEPDYKYRIPLATHIADCTAMTARSEENHHLLKKKKRLWISPQVHIDQTYNNYYAMI